jgi:hypothetical protein
LKASREQSILFARLKEKLEAYLAQFRTLDEAEHLLEEIEQTVGQLAIAVSKLKQFREVWTGLKLAHQYGATHICLGNDPPDILLRKGDEVVKLEVTEVMTPGRKRSEEIWQEEKAPTNFPKANSHEYRNVNDIALALECAVAKKRQIEEAATMVLGIYLNIPCWPSEEKAVEAAISDLQSRPAPFQKIWVQWR